MQTMYQKGKTRSIIKEIDLILDHLDKSIKDRQERYNKLLSGIDELKQKAEKVTVNFSNILTKAGKQCVICGSSRNVIYSGPKCRNCYQKAWSKKQKRKL